MQVEHKTEKGTVIFVKVPDEASDLTYPKVGMIDLYFQNKVKSECEEDNYISIALPDLGFELIGLTSEVTDSQIIKMVDVKNDLRYADRYDLTGYMDYGKLHSDGKPYWYAEPLDSFKSLIQHLEVYEANPYGQEPFNSDMYYPASMSIMQKIRDEWQESQSRTGKWIVLFKPNEK